MKKILVAEDHAIVRIAIVTVLKGLFAKVDITESASMDEMKKALAGKSFDLLIMDISIPGGEGTRMIKIVRNIQSNIPILVMSAHDEETYAERYLRAGADGYINKGKHPDEIKRAIRKVINREKYIGEEIHGSLLDSTENEDSTHKQLLSLSDREMEIMNLLVKGFKPTEIKSMLKLELSTISTYKLRILKKMKVPNLMKLAEKLMKNDK